MARRHGKDTVVYVDGYDLSGASNNFEVTNEADTAEVTGYGDARKRYVIGHMAGMITHAGWFDDETGGIHEILEARLGSSVLVCTAYGDFIGAKGAAGSALNVKTYNASSPIGGGVAVNAQYESAGQTGIDYIDVLQNKGTVAATAAEKDDGATSPSNSGFRAYLQVFQVLGGTPIYVIQHSTASGAGFTGLGTFSGFTDVGAEAIAAAGTVRRYLKLDVSGGSAIVFVGYRRLQPGE